MRDGTRVLAVVTLALAPFVWTVVHVGRHTVQVPVHDQWQVQVPIALAAAEGTLRLPGLLAPYLEHRYVVTRALTAINARLLGWDLRVDAWVNVALGLATLLLLADLLRRHRPGAAALGAALCSALVFSARQRWTWGLLSAFLGVVLLLTLALWTLTRRPPGWRPLLIAAGLAGLATWSAGPGVVVWPAVAVASGLAGYRRPAHAAFWIGAFGAVIAAFLVGYERRPMAVASVAQLARYTLAFLGGPLVPESATFMSLAVGLGALGLGLLVVTLVGIGRAGESSALAAPWLGLCLFSLGAAALAALARAPLLDTVPFQPLRARYVSLASPYWIGLVGLALLAIPGEARPGRRRSMAGLVSLLLVAIAPCYLIANVTAARAPVRPTPAHEECLKAFPTSRDATCLADVVYGIRAVQPRIDELARLRLAVFRR